MNVRSELEETLRTIDDLIEAARAEWARQQVQWGGDLPAEAARDHNGRPLLTDLIVARANILLALKEYQ